MTIIIPTWLCLIAIVALGIPFIAFIVIAVFFIKWVMNENDEKEPQIT